MVVETSANYLSRPYEQSWGPNTSWSVRNPLDISRMFVLRALFLTFQTGITGSILGVRRSYSDRRGLLATLFRHMPIETPMRERCAATWAQGTSAGARPGRPHASTPLAWPSPSRGDAMEEATPRPHVAARGRDTPAARHGSAHTVEAGRARERPRPHVPDILHSQPLVKLGLQTVLHFGNFLH